MAIEQRRGRPRSETARKAVLAAARELIEQSGAPAVTIDRVAQRSGVGKPTIYRSWANRHEVVMAALMDEAPPAIDTNRSGSAVAALRGQLRRMIELFASPVGRNISSLLATAEGDTEIAKAFRTHFLQARRDEGRKLLAAGIEAGELRTDLDVEVVLDLLYGPVFYRLLMREGVLDRDWADRVLDHLLSGIVASVTREIPA